MTDRAEAAAALGAGLPLVYVRVRIAIVGNRQLRIGKLPRYGTCFRASCSLRTPKGFSLDRRFLIILWQSCHFPFACIRGTTAVTVSKICANSGSELFDSGDSALATHGCPMRIPLQSQNDPNEISGISHRDPTEDSGISHRDPMGSRGISATKSFKSWDLAKKLSLQPGNTQSRVVHWRGGIRNDTVRTDPSTNQ